VSGRSVFIPLRRRMMAARLPYLERDEVPAEVQAVFDARQKASGRVPNLNL